MSTTLDAPAATDSPEPSPRPRRTAPHRRALRALASLQLTVVLFALSMVLVFFGTMAQIDKGIWTVVDQYFRSWFVWVPFQLIVEFGKTFFTVDQSATLPGSFPLPGGWLLGGVMLVNLLAAHLTRFKLAWRRAGIITIHAGVILLMVGELVTGLYAIESRMVLQVGEKSSFLDHSRKVELAFVEQGDGATSRTVTVPQSMLVPGSRVTHPDLPLDVEVIEFKKNSKLIPVVGGDDSDCVVSVDGVRMKVTPADENPGVGVSSEGEDAAVTRVRLLKKGTDEVVAERQISLWQYRNFFQRYFLSAPILIGAGEKTYEVQLRNERILKPYTIELLNFEHKQHAGTSMPKDFASTVRLVDGETGEVRDSFRIWMNHPLRHGGETFYQQAVTYGDTGTVLQVVNNRGWLLPYVSCVVVTLGMLIHFGMNLAKFTNRRPA
jgi:hypothetical protein